MYNFLTDNKRLLRTSNFETYQDKNNHSIKVCLNTHIDIDKFEKKIQEIGKENKQFKALVKAYDYLLVNLPYAQRDTTEAQGVLSSMRSAILDFYDEDSEEYEKLYEKYV